MPYSLVIRNGMVVDGSGSAPYHADIGVRGRRIVTIGKISERGAQEVDAEGHAVTPGFIDGHTHMDAQLFWDPLGTCSCFHGVTTVVMGNCGFTLAPAHSDQRELVVRNLERAEDISPAALAAGLDWSWETFPEYLDAVERAPKAINYAAQIGHSALRTWAMGEQAFERTASEDEIVVMERALADALRAGAIGFTTSRNDNHATSDDRAVASRLASWDEVRRLVGLMGDLDLGVFELARETVWPGTAEYDEDLERIRDLALTTGVPITFGAMSLSSLDFLDEIEKAGGRAFGQTHSRGIMSVQSFKTRLPFDVLPGWKQIRSLSLDEQRRIFSDPEQRKRLVTAAHGDDYPVAIGAEARRPKYDEMYLFDRPVPPYSSVAEIAADRRCDPVDLIIDMALASDFDQMFIQPLSSVDPDVLRATMKHPRAVMTFSDAGAHVSQISDCSIQTYLLAHWVRDRQEFTLEEAVRMLTQVPAQAWGLVDRGLVREGSIADLAVFDPETVSPDLPIVTTDLPGAARRLTQKASGFLAVIVGGELSLHNGAPAGAMAGELLRGPFVRS
jgi:N-acyl-D-amino-acid deacylase